MRRYFRRLVLVTAITAGVAGCRYDYQATGTPPQAIRSDLTSLGAELGQAFQGDRAAARAYFGMYQVLADCVSNPRFGWKKPADIERDVIAVRELLDLRHQQFPDVTKIVSQHLMPLRENKDLTEDSRRVWQQCLAELAAGCREAGR